MICDAELGKVHDHIEMINGISVEEGLHKRVEGGNLDTSYLCRVLLVALSNV